MAAVDNDMLHNYPPINYAICPAAKVRKESGLEREKIKS